MKDKIDVDDTYDDTHIWQRKKYLSSRDETGCIHLNKCQFRISVLKRFSVHSETKYLIFTKSHSHTYNLVSGNDTDERNIFAYI